MRAADGGDANDTTDHGEGECQSKRELFHWRLPGQQFEEPCGQEMTSVLLTAATATAPPITPSASAKVKASFFIGHSRFSTEDFDRHRRGCC